MSGDQRVLRITSNGNCQNTKVTLDGETVPDVRSIDWRIDAETWLCSASMSVLAPHLDVTLDDWQVTFDGDSQRTLRQHLHELRALYERAGPTGMDSDESILLGVIGEALDSLEVGET